MFDHLLCDCDGALVVSDVIARRVLLDMLRAAFPALDSDAVQTAFDAQAAPQLSGLETRFGIALDDGFRAAFACNAEAALERSAAAIIAVRRALVRIPLRVSIVSSQPQANLAESIAHAGLADAFAGRLFSAAGVSRPKPHPDLYLHAARELKVEPERCLAVADNIAGLNAARAAGMTTIAFVGASRLPGGYAQVLRKLGVDYIIERMEELPEIVARAMAGLLQAVPR
jgi:HAD superfamily hydrolase (TIGR01509 family)